MSIRFSPYAQAHTLAYRAGTVKQSAGSSSNLSGIVKNEAIIAFRDTLMDCNISLGKARDQGISSPLAYKNYALDILDTTELLPADTTDSKAHKLSILLPTMVLQALEKARMGDENISSSYELIEKANKALESEQLTSELRNELVARARLVLSEFAKHGSEMKVEAAGKGLLMATEDLIKKINDLHPSS